MSEAKRLAGQKAIDYVEDGMVVGVGTGSTVAFFIDALAKIQDRIKGAVSSSDQSTQRLRAHGMTLSLRHPQPHIRTLIELVGLHRLPSVLVIVPQPAGGVLAAG